MDSGMVFKIPVDAGGEVYPGICAHYNAIATLVELEEILVALHKLGFEFTGGTPIDTLKKVVCGICPDIKAGSGCNENGK